MKKENKVRIPNIQGYRILVDPQEIEETYKSTISGLVKVGVTTDHEKRNMQEGVVLQVGADCYKNDACDKPWCKVGDIILFKRGAAVNWYDENEKLYIILNEEDVLATF